MSLLRRSSVVVVVVVAGVLTACSSCSPSASSPSGTSGTSGGTSGDVSGGAACTVTFGGDAASINATSCNKLGPLVSDSTVLSFNGNAAGIDSGLFVFSIKFKNPLAVKTYQTADLFYISDNLTLIGNKKNYSVDFDSSDATKTRDGSVTATFTSADSGTIDITLDTTDKPPAHVTAHITF